MWRPLPGPGEVAMEYADDYAAGLVAVDFLVRSAAR